VVRDLHRDTQLVDLLLRGVVAAGELVVRDTIDVLDPDGAEARVGVPRARERRGALHRRVVRDEASHAERSADDREQHHDDEDRRRRTHGRHRRRAHHRGAQTGAERSGVDGTATSTAAKRSADAPKWGA
jgi:hypothetical protein